MAPFTRFRGVYVGAPLVLLAFALFAASPLAATASSDDDLWCGANNCYEVLNLLPNATSSEIKKSYFKLSLKWHPDKNPSEEAKGEFAKLAQAYLFHSEPRRREVRIFIFHITLYTKRKKRNHPTSCFFFCPPAQSSSTHTQSREGWTKRRHAFRYHHRGSRRRAARKGSETTN